MDASPLIRLPPELRDRIYELLVFQPDNISIAVRTRRPKIGTGLDLRYMYICRQMRKEATSIFYGANTFTVITDYLETEGDPSDLDARKPFKGIHNWLSTMGSANAAHPSRVCIDLGCYGVEGRHRRITKLLDAAKEEIWQLAMPHHTVFLRSAYFVLIFSPVGHIMKYIDIPLTDKDAARRRLESPTSIPLDSATSVAMKQLPKYSTNREEIDLTVALFKGGLLNTTDHQSPEKKI